MVDDRRERGCLAHRRVIEGLPEGVGVGQQVEQVVAAAAEAGQVALGQVGESEGQSHQFRIVGNFGVLAGSFLEGRVRGQVFLHRAGRFEFQLGVGLDEGAAGGGRIFGQAAWVRGGALLGVEECLGGALYLEAVFHQVPRVLVGLEEHGQPSFFEVGCSEVGVVLRRLIAQRDRRRHRLPGDRFIVG